MVRPSLERVKPTPQGSAMKALVAPKGHRKAGRYEAHRNGAGLNAAVAA